MANYTKCLISHTEKEIIVEFFSEEESVIQSLRTDAGKHPVSSNTLKKVIVFPFIVLTYFQNKLEKAYFSLPNE